MQGKWVGPAGPSSIGALIAGGRGGMAWVLVPSDMEPEGTMESLIMAFPEGAVEGLASIASEPTVTALEYSLRWTWD